MSVKPRILFVDDDADTREIVRLLLTADGFDVICVDDPNRAVDLIEQQKFDVLLMDNWMSPTSGVELCRRLREFDRHLPIVFYSAAAYETDKVEAKEAGAFAYITKPALHEVLVGTLQSALRNNTGLSQEI
jgi:DNA-binding response OmpR family regulator